MNLKDGTPIHKRANKWDWELQPVTRVGEESMIRLHIGELVRVRLDVAEDGSLWLVQVGFAVQCPTRSAFNYALQNPELTGGQALSSGSHDATPTSSRRARLTGAIRVMEDIARVGGCNAYWQEQLRVQSDSLRSLL